MINIIKNLLSTAMVTVVLVVFILPSLATSTHSTKDTKTNLFDIVILGGRVMDPETNFDAVRNVGIKDGIIKTITKKRHQKERNYRCERTGCCAWVH